MLEDVVVSYVASEDVSDVWDAYVIKAGEGSVRGFLGWVSEWEFRAVLDERGGELFPEYRETLDVSQRTSKDALDTLRYFRGE